MTFTHRRARVRPAATGQLHVASVIVLAATVAAACTTDSADSHVRQSAAAGSLGGDTQASADGEHLLLDVLGHGDRAAGQVELRSRVSVWLACHGRQTVTVLVAFPGSGTSSSVGVDCRQTDPSAHSTRIEGLPNGRANISVSGASNMHWRLQVFQPPPDGS